MYCKEDIVLVILAIQKCLKPQRTEFFIELLNLPLKLKTQRFIILALIKLYKLLCLIDFIDKLFPWIIPIFERIEILENFFRFLWIIPEIRGGSLLFYSLYL